MKTLVALVFAACAFGFGLMRANASILLSVSDLISTSVPGVDATHVITLKPFKSIPASGKIVITPADGEFTIPVGFDYRDIDLAVATSTDYVERSLASLPNATDDGVVVTTGASGSIEITLNSSEGIAAGDRVRIKLGTNASEGAGGTLSIANPVPVGSHRIRLDTDDDLGGLLDTTSGIISIVSPVALIATPIAIEPTRSSGLPSGLIAAGNTTIELSLETDTLATCRYSLVPGVAFTAMTEEFSPSLGTLFTKVNTGYQDNTTYTYYVRCRGAQGFSNSTDYPISFALDVTPSNDRSVSEGAPAPQSGFLGYGGNGTYPNGSGQLFLATVNFSGIATPNTTVMMLKDGKVTGTTQVRSDGTFAISITDLERGTYSFQLYETDAHGIVSASYSSTLSVGQGTINAITGAIIPPTLALASNTIQVGDDAKLVGQTIPSAQVEVSALRQAASSTLSVPQLYTASTSPQGSWELTIPGSELSQGTYLIKARTVKSEQIISGYSKTISLGVGRSAAPDVGSRTDINRDGKVNLVDFSILLSHWRTDDGDADINLDGIVNLADFSILLFNWTG